MAVAARACLLAAAFVGEDLSVVGRWVTTSPALNRWASCAATPDGVPDGWLDTVLAVRALLSDSALGGVLSILSGALLPVLLRRPGQVDPCC